MSAAVRMSPSPSRSHCTAAPAMNALPSSAYVVWPPICHATVVTSPCLLFVGVLPMFMSAKAPVPYVHFTSPSAKHACPNSAAC